MASVSSGTQQQNNNAVPQERGGGQWSAMQNRDFRQYMEANHVTESITRALTALFDKLNSSATDQTELDPILFISDHLLQQHVKTRTT